MTFTEHVMYTIGSPVYVLAGWVMHDITVGVFRGRR